MKYELSLGDTQSAAAAAASALATAQASVATPCGCHMWHTESRSLSCRQKAFNFSLPLRHFSSLSRQIKLLRHGKIFRQFNSLSGCLQIHLIQLDSIPRSAKLIRLRLTV